MNKAIGIMAIVAMGMEYGCKSSTTYSYIFIGDTAFKEANIPPAALKGLKADQPVVKEIPDNQGTQKMGPQEATNGTAIIIGVNSTTSKPVDVSAAANGNSVNVSNDSALKTAVRVGGAAAGGTVGGPVGGAVGAMLPEAATAVQTVAQEAIQAVKGK